MTPSPTTPNRQAQLAQALVWQSDQPQADHVLDQLDNYITAQLTGAPYRNQFANVALHLDACIECAEAYARLYDLALAEQRNALPQLSVIPTPDLTFLQPMPKATLLAQVRGALRQIGQQLILQLTPDLLPALRPALATTALRAPADEARYHEMLIQLKEEGLPLAVTAYRDAQQPDRCLVEVEVSLPGHAWPDLGEVAIELIYNRERHTALTDAWGLAVFEEIPVAGLADLEIDMTVGRVNVDQ